MLPVLPATAARGCVVLPRRASAALISLSLSLSLSLSVSPPFILRERGLPCSGPSHPGFFLRLLLCGVLGASQHSYLEGHILVTHAGELEEVSWHGCCTELKCCWHHCTELSSRRHCHCTELLLRFSELETAKSSTVRHGMMPAS